MLAFDPISEDLILFGGRNTTADSPALNDTWAYDTAGNTWTQIAPSINPGGRYHRHALVLGGFDGRLVLFGGPNDTVGGGGGNYDGNLWKWTGLLWFK